MGEGTNIPTERGRLSQAFQLIRALVRYHKKTFFTAVAGASVAIDEDVAAGRTECFLNSVKLLTSVKQVLEALYRRRRTYVLRE